MKWCQMVTWIHIKERSKCVCVCSQLFSHVQLCNPMDCSSPDTSVNGNFPGKNTGVGCHFLLQGIFLTQGLNSCLLLLLHWQVDSLYQDTNNWDQPYEETVRKLSSTSQGKRTHKKLSTFIFVYQPLERWEKLFFYSPPSLWYFLGHPLQISITYYLLTIIP